MEMTRKGRIHYLAPEFAGGNSGCMQGFTTRHEGVSRPPYNSLNLGTNTEDPPHNIEGNRSILARTFGIPMEKLVTVRQNHGSDILVIDEPNDDYSHFLSIECDAIITNQPGVMIGVTVADCVPILLHDPEKRVIAAVHAGWQGTAAGIVAKTIKGMAEIFGSRPASLLASIGPCIHQCCYEVDKPVMDRFIEHGQPWEHISEKSDGNHWKLDMPLANRMQIEESGLPASSILTASHCVSCQKDLFFSYRRDKGETGRQLGFILIT